MVLILLLLTSNATIGKADTENYGSYGETGFYGKYEKTIFPDSDDLTEDEKLILSTSPDEQIKIPAAGDASNEGLYLLSLITIVASIILYWKLSLNKTIV
ncbi:hypothetical protein [Candidatus Enterococcus mangumiae]|uniref:Gram-positive cocci surface proteins LPxTG domain-containing protein n=1 Tax=Candidatus Enterococcus mangumiae TaxID=2230878 RepID=A0ABZ2SUV2_9ENTE|nr:hypothetical protein [Enterococcus sp. DIV1094]MBO0491250.1 hypothetical protein [Enterococcus sp. DIV1094]